ncbi:hypothetical protein [Bradyrhizobium sp. sGM-13]|uniref:hypothetical protein n=1 Tax=Bradyrhizobium sp. sGM-13 TaxID=2831781 RepID=UPI001BCAB49E|nr:hypothetical protein [Bradyrhizobium sp. sGM-13]
MEYVVVIVVIFILIAWLTKSREEKSPAQKGIGASEQPNQSGGLQKRNDDIVSIVEPLGDEASIRRSFRSVFAMLTADRQAALINFYRQQRGVDELEAMQIAILDRQNDEDRFK